MMFPGKEITEEEYEELEYLAQDLHTYLHVCYEYTEKHVQDAKSMGTLNWILDRVIDDIDKLKRIF